MLTGETPLLEHQHSEVIEALEDLAMALRASKPPAVIPAPVVNVEVEAPTLAIPASRVTVAANEPVSYRFTIERNSKGVIKEILAEPIGNG